MPKMKTHSGAKKRFKVTGSGKITRERTNLRHLLEVKSSRRKRALAVDTVRFRLPRALRVVDAALGCLVLGFLAHFSAH